MDWGILNWGQLKHRYTEHRITSTMKKITRLMNESRRGLVSSVRQGVSESLCLSHLPILITSTDCDYATPPLVLFPLAFSPFPGDGKCLTKVKRWYIPQREGAGTASKNRDWKTFRPSRSHTSEKEVIIARTGRNTRGFHQLAEWKLNDNADFV